MLWVALGALDPEAEFRRAFRRGRESPAIMRGRARHLSRLMEGVTKHQVDVGVAGLARPAVDACERRFEALDRFVEEPDLRQRAAEFEVQESV